METKFYQGRDGSPDIAWLYVAWLYEMTAAGHRVGSGLYLGFVGASQRIEELRIRKENGRQVPEV
jgi:hypothetical protein